ncbi:biliverdin-producing heme oxygenase [Neolewinella agarilytica]|uniref:biliverdin-producing heme oxygenase n=1 Tax=Neolewinella agarilytica TaxID=478744 RepID=UPI0023564B91|nr:biliverdin-producing heme oxygenase [Neolewinella agarilytica]
MIKPDLTLSSAAAYLKQGTREEHLLTEQALSSAKIMRSEISRLEYTHLLLTHHKLWSAATTSIFGEEKTLLPYQPLALKLQESVGNDLTELGMKLPPVEDLFAAQQQTAGKMGVAYVLLGAGLGAGMMLPRLRNCPELKAYDVFRFYSSSAALRMTDWKRFRNLLDEVVAGEENRQSALSAATSTFGAFRHFYQSFSGSSKK